MLNISPQDLFKLHQVAKDDPELKKALEALDLPAGSSRVDAVESATSDDKFTEFTGDDFQRMLKRLHNDLIDGVISFEDIKKPSARAGYMASMSV